MSYLNPDTSAIDVYLSENEKNFLNILERTQYWNVWRRYRTCVAIGFPCVLPDFMDPNRPVDSLIEKHRPKPAKSRKRRLPARQPPATKRGRIATGTTETTAPATLPSDSVRRSARPAKPVKKLNPADVYGSEDESDEDADPSATHQERNSDSDSDCDDDTVPGPSRKSTGGKRGRQSGSQSAASSRPSKLTAADLEQIVMDPKWKKYKGVDTLIYCYECKNHMIGRCREHSHFVVDGDYDWQCAKPLAEQSLPEGLSLSSSRYKKAGRGVWTDKDFKAGAVFGPYFGNRIPAKDYEESKSEGYSWEIRSKDSETGKETSYYIDASNEKKSNWLRYVNCAYVENHQNLIAYQEGNNIWYWLFKDVPKGTELLVFYGENYLTDLMKMKGVELDVEKAIQTYTPAHPCPDCDLCFATANFLAQHRRQHIRREGRHRCEQCDYSTDRFDNLDRHISTIHRKEHPFKCETCGKSFTQQPNLTRHLLTHTKEKPYKCTVCEKGFTRNGHLQRHIATVHERQQQHVCAECGKVFGEAGHLRRHISTMHSGERKHVYTMCNERFGYSHHLKTHMSVVHLGQRKHVCTICSERFGQSASLKTHISVVHLGERKHACSMCSYRAGHSSHLKRHMKSMHGEHS